MSYPAPPVYLWGRAPTHPAVILREEFFPNSGLTVTALASLLGVSRSRLRRLMSGKSRVCEEMAFRLGALFGTSPEMWLNLQRNHDMWHAYKKVREQLPNIQPLWPDLQLEGVQR